MKFKQSHVLIFTDVANSWNRTRRLTDSHHMFPAITFPIQPDSQSSRSGAKAAWRATTTRQHEQPDAGAARSEVTFICTGAYSASPLPGAQMPHENPCYRCFAQLRLLTGPRKKKCIKYIHFNQRSRVKPGWERVISHALYLNYFSPH